jgi:8-oxo-dGTP pyrophosphatase MutT (NUDIX family)
MRNGLLRQVHRLGYWVLWALAFVRPPHGRGAKGLLVNAGEVLLVRHTYGPKEWELPGGGARRGEEPIETLRRELREEVGVELASATPLGPHNGPGRLSRTRVSYYVVDLPDRAVVPDPVEIAEVIWCDPAATPRPLGWHAREALERALRGDSIASTSSDPGSPPRG